MAEKQTITFSGENPGLTLYKPGTEQVIAAVSYELLRFGARHRANRFVRWIFMPGIWLQMITTKQPDDEMIEVAVASMREALTISGDEAPDGSLDPLRRPMSADATALASGS